jgi:hypothetical protein
MTKRGHLTGREVGYLKGVVRAKPDRFRAELDKEGGTPRQRERRKLIHKIMLQAHPDKLRAWYGPTMQPSPVKASYLSDRP